MPKDIFLLDFSFLAFVIHLAGGLFINLCALESGHEARIVQIGFSAAFCRVNNLGILYKLYCVGIGGSVLFILTKFLSNRSQHVMVDGFRNKLVNVVSGVPHDSGLGALLFLLYTSELFPFWKIS